MDLSTDTVEWAKLVVEIDNLKAECVNLGRTLTELDEAEEGDQAEIKKCTERLEKCQQEVESLSITERELATRISIHPSDGEVKTEQGESSKIKAGHESEPSYPSVRGARVSADSFRPQRPSKYQKGENFSRFARRFKEHVSLYTDKPTNLDLYMLSFIECERTWEKLSKLKLSVSEKTDIDKLIKRFSEEIFPQTDARAMRTELLALRQNNSETIEDFCFRISECASRAAYKTQQMREESCLQALLAGVTSSRIKEKLLESDVESFQQARKLAMKFERISAAVKPELEKSEAELENQLPVFSINPAGSNSRGNHKRSHNQKQPTIVNPFNPSRNNGQAIASTNNNGSDAQFSGFNGSQYPGNGIHSANGLNPNAIPYLYNGTVINGITGSSGQHITSSTQPQSNSSETIAYDRPHNYNSNGGGNNSNYQFRQQRRYNNNYYNNNTGHGQQRYNNWSNTYTGCYICGSFFHRRRFCPLANNNQGQGYGGYTSNRTYQQQGPPQNQYNNSNGYNRPPLNGQGATRT